MRARRVVAEAAASLAEWVPRWMRKCKLSSRRRERCETSEAKELAAGSGEAGREAGFEITEQRRVALAGCRRTREILQDECSSVVSKGERGSAGKRKRERSKICLIAGRGGNVDESVLQREYIAIQHKD